ncbi:hypothetical protein FGO68_gene16112 [Halteria grandinella]|uniref:Uncharacterized protein n=1 Tax=Halteria grandinella TaxID=5974 RepID=A0A8J8NAN8_HALGN|nr:hypothetical protein FGO68_gene16112 [Halteria grandinella]
MNSCFQANILAVSAIRPPLFNLVQIWGPQLLVWVLSLSDWDLSTPALTPGQISCHSEFVRIWQDLTPPSPIGSFTCMRIRPRLFLKTFRGVRAISQFDWPFTPTHKSSKYFSTQTGSVLHVVLPTLQPAHGQITKFRVYSP